jgi:hypothetical protein
MVQNSVPTHSPFVDPQALVRRKAYIPTAKTPLPPRNPAQFHDDDDIYDDYPPSPKRARIVEPDFEEEGIGNADNWRRRSKRQRESVIPAADMVMWDDIDEDDYDIASETSESD